MGASGDIMFGPWAAYFPVSLGLGYDIVTICPCAMFARGAKDAEVLDAGITEPLGAQLTLLSAYLVVLRTHCYRPTVMAREGI